MRMLIDAGADINYAVSRHPGCGDTALHMAVANRLADCVEQLSLAGADTTIRNVDGRTARDEAERLRPVFNF